MCSNMKDLVETHLGYTALTNELECCFHSILLIFRRANRLVGGGFHHLFCKAEKQTSSTLWAFRSDTWGQ